MNTRIAYRGVIVPMITPFTPDGAIDEPAVGRIVEHLLAGGVEGIFPLGTTGEYASIHSDDKRRLIAATVQHVAGRATVYAGIASNCFRESIEAAAAFRGLGADVVVAHVPSYYPLPDAEIEAHFRRLADHVPLPLVMYNIPATTHHSIPVDVVDRLRQHANVVAIKDSANDAARLTELLKRTGGRHGFPVLLGCSAQFSHGLRHGGVGLVPSGAHVVPTAYRAMFRAAMAERWDEVERLQRETDAACAPFLKGRGLGDQLAALKVILEKQGLCGRTMLPPLRTMSD
jgi:dihydrodipicolinate synthase/N-acetylneuraminate lyase